MNPASWLTPGGAGAAVVVGATVWWGAGVGGLALLFLFFISGSLLTTATDGRTGRPGGPRRRARQVVANGWTAAAGALLVPHAPDVGFPLLAGGLAAAQADTWATEIGARSRTPPRHLLAGTVVPHGTSGGVTGLGSLGGTLGAAAMAVVAAAVSPVTIWPVFGAGIAGMLVDSLLGASVQARYRCGSCAAETEHPLHTCGRPAQRVRGWSWLDNDLVNAMATGVGGALAVFGAALV